MTNVIDSCYVTTPQATTSTRTNNKKEADICISNDKSKGTRLIFHGGARNASDNSAFQFAAKNVAKDYKNIADRLLAKSGKFIVDTINSQKDNSIASVDILTHGSPTAFYMIRNKVTKEYASIYKDIPVEYVMENNLYTGKTAKFIESWGGGSETDTINNIDYNKFTKNAIIEIHGCRAADEIEFLPYDIIVKNLSEALYDSGKICAVVIGHLTKAEPLINAPKDTPNEKQDYRYKKRAVFHNGKTLFVTNVKGKISRDEIANRLNNLK